MDREELEIWKPIKNFSYYRVSNLGRVESRVGARPRILKNIMDGSGYYGVTLSGRRFLCIHRLVLEAFIGPPPEGYEANHKNGIKTDNRAENLEWITRSENLVHAYRLGLIVPPTAKLKKKDVLEIRRLARLGVPVLTIAKDFPVIRQSIDNIINRVTWKYIYIYINEKRKM